MVSTSHVGKSSPRFMERAVYPYLGSKSRRVLLGPARGRDNGVITSGKGRVMIITVDPVSVIPAFGMRLSAWLSVHLIASDYATSGNSPEHAIFSYNFPAEMSESEREDYVKGVGNECRKLKVSIVGGHSGSYPGGGYTVIGAGSMFGFARAGHFVSPSMAKPGDSILLTKGAALESTASLATSFPKYVDRVVGRSVGSKARQMVRQCSVVAEAVAASTAGLGQGRVTSMHDVTEGGVVGALQEMAMASGRAFDVSLDRIPISREAKMVCSAFGIDPLTSLGEGSLIITCGMDWKEELVRRVKRVGVAITEIGFVRSGNGLWKRKGDNLVRLGRPKKDGYWEAYDDALAKGLS